MRCYFAARDETPRKRLSIWGSFNVHWYASLSLSQNITHTISKLVSENVIVVWLNLAGTGMGAAAVFERGDGVDELRNARKVESHGLLSKDAR